LDIFTGESVTIKKNGQSVTNIHRPHTNPNPNPNPTPTPSPSLKSQMNSWSSNSGTSSTHNFENNAVTTYYEKKDNMMFTKLSTQRKADDVEYFTFYKLAAGATVEGEATNGAQACDNSKYAGWVVCQHTATAEARSIVKASKAFSGRPFFGYRKRQ
jgi:hypothetical protein